MRLNAPEQREVDETLPSGNLSETQEARAPKRGGRRMVGRLVDSPLGEAHGGGG